MKCLKNRFRIVSGAMPSVDSAIRFRYPSHVILSKQKALYEINEDERESDEDMEEEDFVYLYHSLKNNRTIHMCGSPKCEVSIAGLLTLNVV